MQSINKCYNSTSMMWHACLKSLARLICTSSYKLNEFCLNLENFGASSGNATGTVRPDGGNRLKPCKLSSIVIISKKCRPRTACWSHYRCVLFLQHVTIIGVPRISRIFGHQSFIPIELPIPRQHFQAYKRQSVSKGIFLWNDTAVKDTIVLAIFKSCSHINKTLLIFCGKNAPLFIVKSKVMNEEQLTHTSHSYQAAFYRIESY